MDNDLAQQAISAALRGNWSKALKINLELLDFAPEDTSLLNRIARAYAEIGKLSKARAYAKKVIVLDPLNSIAIKHIEKWTGSDKIITTFHQTVAPHTFLEEPGRTKMIELLNIGGIKVIATLDCGDEVKLTANAHKISVSTVDGKFIGKLPDDISNRLIKLIRYGNTYLVVVKSVNSKSIVIFIRELKRSPKVQNVASFKNV